MPDSALNALLSRKTLLTAGIFFVLITGALLLYFGYPVARKWFPPCPFYELTHLYCPGCGSTRAAFYFLHGDLPGVFRSNPIFIPTLIFVFFLWKVPGKFSRPKIVNLYLILIAFYWILRNLPCFPFTCLAPAPVPF